MSLKEQLSSALHQAMKAGEEIKKSTVRMALAAIKNAEIQSRKELNDGEVLGILQKEVRTRREALEEAETAKRQDLIAAAHAEIAVLEAFLPAAMSEAKLLEMIREAIAETGAGSPTDMGRVMKVLLPKVQGQADGKQVSSLVRQLLQG